MKRYGVFESVKSKSPTEQLRAATRKLNLPTVRP